MKIQNLQVLQAREARVKRSIQQIATELQILQRLDLADNFETIVGNSVLGLPAKVSVPAGFSRDEQGGAVLTYQVQRREELQTPQSQGQRNEHVPVEV